MRTLTCLAPLLSLVLACGGGKKEPAEPTPPPVEEPATPAPAPPDAAPAQTLAEGVTELCKAPSKAEADPAWKDAKDQAAKDQIIGGKLKDGVTNQEVLDFIGSVDAMKGEGEKYAKLKDLAKKAEVTDCPLEAAWKPGKGAGKEGKDGKAGKKKK